MAKTIKILSTSDVHGTIFPYRYADLKEMNHGFARLKTLIDSLRDENTILIDNGDTIEGTPFTNYHYNNFPDQVCEVSTVMKMMKYDYVNVGNHDFNYGEEALFTHLKETNALCLTANVLYKGKQLGPDYIIKEFDNKKLALFALTTQAIPNWEKPQNIKNFEFLDAFETAKRILDELKGKVDYVVCIYHAGFEYNVETNEPSEKLTGENQAYKILKELGGIDAMILGHQHRKEIGETLGAVYTQPAFDGAFLSCIEINLETNKIQAQLIPVESAPDQEIINLASEKEKLVQKQLNSPLGYTPMDLIVHDEYNDRLHKSQLVTLINKAQLAKTKADISGTAIFLAAKGFTGDITMRDIVTTYFFPNTLVVKKINGKVLKEYLEKCADFWIIKDNKIIINPLYDFPTVQYHNYDMLDGIEYTIKVSNPYGSRIISLTRNNQEIKEDDEFSLVINNYRSTGGGDFDMLKDLEIIKEYQETTISVIADYIKEEKTIDFKPINNIKVII